MELLLLFIDIVLLAVVVAGFVLLYRHVSYAYIDTCSLFIQAESMRGYASIEKNFVEIYPVQENLTFSSRQRFLVNNLFLNILRHFPADRRLRSGQKFNFLTYILFVLCLLAAFLLLGDQYGLTGGRLVLLSLTGALAICARTRLMLVCAMVLSDCLNYLFFALALLLVFAMDSGVADWQVVLFGLLNGLAFRNKTQDLFLVIAGFLFLLVVCEGFWQLPLYLLVVLLMNLEWLCAELMPGTGSYKTLYAYLGLFGPFFNRFQNKTVPSVESALVQPFWQRACGVVRRLLSFYRGKGIWHSQGAALLLTPVSLVYLGIVGGISGGVLFCLLYAGLTLLGLAVMTHRVALEGEERIGEGNYLGGRQAYMAFAPLLVVVFAAWLHAVAQGQVWLATLVCLYLGFYLLHQLGRVLDYYFSDAIHESHFVELRKKPESWSVELGDYLRNLEEKPAVILGDHLMYGKPHNFFQWHRDLRCVDVHCCLSDEEVLDCIERFGVTHIVLTPFSVLRNSKSSLGKDVLTKSLAQRLQQLPTRSPSLKIYRVVGREAGK